MKDIYDVVILEKFRLFSSGIKSFLTATNGFNVIGEATNTQKLFKIIDGILIDIILFDIIHWNDAGLKILSKIHRHYPQIPILLIISQDYSDCYNEYLKLGVAGFVFKDDPPTELVKALRSIASGNNYFPKERKIFKDLESVNYPVDVAQKKRRILTEREISVLKLFCSGLTYKEIGKKLFISPRTVETHKKNILSKLMIHSTAEMVKYAFHHRILT